MTTPEAQRDARAFLMSLARRAYRQGLSQREWLDYHEEPRDICRSASLDPRVLEHIAAFVWTFRKSG